MNFLFFVHWEGPFWLSRVGEIPHFSGDGEVPSQKELKSNFEELFSSKVPRQKELFPNPVIETTCSQIDQLSTESVINSSEMRKDRRRSSVLCCLSFNLIILRAGAIRCEALLLILLHYRVFEMNPNISVKFRAKINGSLNTWLLFFQHLNMKSYSTLHYRLVQKKGRFC